MDRLTKPAKRILYVLRKKGNCYRLELSFGEKKYGRKQSAKILQRLIKKGLVSSHKSYLYENNKSIARSNYYLTDEGKKVADEIIQEVKDEYDYYNEWV